MCGIVGAVAERNVLPILMEGLRRLEYRGYDSAGVALLADEDHLLQRCRAQGKVAQLAQALAADPIAGHCGIAHTRWATHGQPLESNAHPHICNHRIALVHNGIIENHQALRAAQLGRYRFTSETDTEVIVHQVFDHLERGGTLLQAVQRTTLDLQGAYALAVIDSAAPDLLVVARRGSPLVIGLGIGENFIASDVAALLPVTQRFIFLEEGDAAQITLNSVTIYDAAGAAVERTVHESSLNPQAVQLGNHRHYMHKEIFEQPDAVQQTLEGRIGGAGVIYDLFPQLTQAARQQLAEIRQIQIVACGTSYHAGLTARYWFEAILGIACQVEVASEFRYRSPVVLPNTLFITISQSGETADTLAALQLVKQRHPEMLTLTICNAPESSLTRASMLTLLTHAGPEIGVASTKAFTTQLTALSLLLLALGKLQQRIPAEQEEKMVLSLRRLPGLLQQALQLEPQIAALATEFADKHNALFLGRGTHYPIAMEGALKLKEISYIHAEAYPAGELKHGPLALVDDQMPIVVVAPNDALLEKLKSNLHEVQARGGRMIIFTEQEVDIAPSDAVTVLPVISGLGPITAPILLTIPLQLLAYHVALIKGTDVDQPRNLAKSVTVE
ncbi:MAG: glutamine--fructose-6-phosphate transaminase (isomerizing) [Gammaproteobacteria bacterium]|nr:glutamine--fructose-6-phosphate transaminase (isomerizing) [Gammaproteobacteria bacterium]